MQARAWAEAVVSRPGGCHAVADTRRSEMGALELWHRRESRELLRPRRDEAGPCGSVIERVQATCAGIVGSFSIARTASTLAPKAAANWSGCARSIFAGCNRSSRPRCTQPIVTPRLASDRTSSVHGSRPTIMAPANKISRLCSTWVTPGASSWSNRAIAPATPGTCDTWERRQCHCRRTRAVVSARAAGHGRKQQRSQTQQHHRAHPVLSPYPPRPAGGRRATGERIHK